jgi:predicted RNA binding protein YcfA (HicA-like mRNA interferase family)
MARSRTVVEAALTKKGFQETEGDHHFFVYQTKKGKKSLARTKTSHSMKDISDDLLSQMAKQCKVSKRQFLDLIDCDIERDGYENLLSKAGHVDANKPESSETKSSKKK